MAESQNTNANQDGGNNNMNNGGASDSKWYDSLPADVHEHIKGFDNTEAMVKDYVSLKGKVPTVPEKPEDYTYEAPKEHPLPLTEQEIAALRGFAKDAGFTKEQFAKVVQAQLAIRGNHVKSTNEAIKKAEDTLRSEWGQHFDGNLKVADDVINKLFDAEFNEYARKSGLGTHPAFIKGMFKLSKMVSEDSFERGGHTSDDTTPARDPVTGLPMLKYGAGKQ